jgi:predicted heme/steroid binding protein/uncharacterized membrane protein
MKTLTEQELAHYDGKDGRPVYIAHEGNIFDVSASKLWRSGQHMKRHSAGMDLSVDIQAAPHDTSVLDRYPQVGVLAREKVQEKIIPAWLEWLLAENPFLRRHPHPMTVHFPITFMLFNPIFNALFLMTGNRSFETTAFHCLGAGILFTVAAMATGFFTWWFNYMGKMMKPVAIKLPLSAIILIIAIVLLRWRWNVPDIMANLQGVNIFYFVLSLCFLPLISIVGWFGATMTFPIEKKH